MSKCLLYSGGLDSACAFWVLGKPPCLYIGGEHGSARWANAGEVAAWSKQREISAELDKALTVKELDFRPFTRPGVYMLPRTEIMLCAAWAAGFDGVMLAWTCEDAPQAHAAAIAERQRGMVPFEFSVEYPLAHISKAALCQAALKAGAPREFLLASHSCVRTSNGHCGKCHNCQDRQAALEACELA